MSDLSLSAGPYHKEIRMSDLALYDSFLGHAVTGLIARGETDAEKIAEEATEIAVATLIARNSTISS